MKKLEGLGYTVEITAVERGPKLRRVFFTLPNVMGGLRFEMTSFQGGPVEVYTANSEGIFMFRGTVQSYYPGGIEDFRAIWSSEQPSKAAAKAFEASAATKSYEEACAMVKGKAS